MIQAVLLRIDSSDIPGIAPDFTIPGGWQPQNPQEFVVGLDLWIGVSNDPSVAEYFQFEVASPAGRRAARIDTSDGYRRYLVVDRFDWDQIVTYITDRVAGATGDSIDDIVIKLSRYFFWENQKTLRLLRMDHHKSQTEPKGKA